MSENESRRLGTVRDAAEWYDVDVAKIWQWIARGTTVIAPDGTPVKLVAPIEEREDNSLWIVTEIPT